MLACISTISMVISVFIPVAMFVIGTILCIKALKNDKEIDED